MESMAPWYIWGASPPLDPLSSSTEVNFTYSTLPRNKSKMVNEQIPEYDVLFVGAGFGSITTFHRYVLSPFLS
jgi:hypothetical protein